MKGTLVVVLMACFAGVKGQTLEDAEQLYATHQFDAAVEMAKKLLNNPKTEAGANGIIGRIYVDTKKYREGVPYLKKAVELDGDASYVSGWAHAYLGDAYVNLGEREKGKEELNKAIALHATQSSVQHAKILLVQYFATKESLTEMQRELVNAEHGRGFPEWTKKEGAHITYYFQDSKDVTEGIMQNFIRVHEEAYDKINNTFKAVLPCKMVFFVWTDGDLARRLMHHNLGFTNPKLCETNTLINQTIGHEMTHSLSYWGWGEAVKNQNGFIMEGIGVAFDLERNDKTEAARRAVASESIHSVLELWKGENFQDRLVYPVGGAFVKYLFDHSTPEQFKSIVKDQSIENAEKTYGEVVFYRMVKEFDGMIGPK